MTNFDRFLKDYTSDIPTSIAIRAFSGTSWTPEDRANTVINEYSATLNSDYTMLAKYADTDEKRVLLDSEFARYREGYRKHYTAWLNSRSHCMSAAVTGPANFPTRRNQKRFDIEMRRSEECTAYRKKALDAIEKVLRPELRPVMSGDGDAIERLEEKIAKAEANQALWKSVNNAWRKYEKTKDTKQLLDLGLTEEGIRGLEDKIAQAYSWEKQPFVGWQLTNNNANIRRMKERLEQLKNVKAMPDTETANDDNGITVTDCPNENRIRIAFPGKPNESIRSELKHNGFRWTPSLGVWQAYRNYRSIETAKKIQSNYTIK